MFLELRELLATEQFVSLNILGEWIKVIMSSCLHNEFMLATEQFVSSNTLGEGI